jgi:hypothetical protein
MEIAIVFYIILAGVIIYVLGEIIVKIVIDPVQELKRVIAPEKLEQAADEYRKLASMLNAGFRLVPFFPFARVVFFLPKEADIIDARNELIEMSEEIFAAPKSFVISERRKSIEKKLKVI